MTPVLIDGVLHGADDLVGPWVQAGLGGDAIAGPYTALGVLDGNGQLCFGALWFNHRDDDIEVAIYATDIRPALPAVFRRIFAWPFDVLGVARVTAEIAADNERMLRFARGIGMKLEGVKRQAVAGTDKLIFGLLESERPFMRETHGKSPESAAAH